MQEIRLELHMGSVCRNRTWVRVGMFIAEVDRCNANDLGETSFRRGEIRQLTIAASRGARSDLNSDLNNEWSMALADFHVPIVKPRYFLIFSDVAICA